MKISLTILISAVLLTGCGILPQKYDNNEYEMWVRLYVQSQQLNKSCEVSTLADINNQLSQMYTETQVVKVYAMHTPNNAEVSKIADIIANDIVEMQEVYKSEHNVVYCNRKTELLSSKIGEMVKVLPKKKR
jgi:hypothetical protein